MTLSDKEWLDKAILEYILGGLVDTAVIGVSETQLIEEFAPSDSIGRMVLCIIRPTFGGRQRRVQKEMVGGAIRRLVSGGKIGVAKVISVRRRGQQVSDSVRLFKPITALDALSEIG
jgi:hypothetical protein